MSALVRVVSFAALCAALATGCVRRYEEPTAAEPHALVKFRFLHHVTYRTSLAEILRLDGYDVAIPAGVPTEARLRAVRVRPRPSEYRFAVEYFHTVTSTRWETRTETYSCGTVSSPQTCTRTVTQPVTHTDHVTDASCEARLSHLPLAGGVYLVQYDFYGDQACSVSCFRQLDRPGGEFQLVPCGAGEPPVGRTAGSEAPPLPPTYAAPIEVRSIPSSDAPSSETSSDAPSSETSSDATSSPSEGSGRALGSPR